MMFQGQIARLAPRKLSSPSVSRGFTLIELLVALLVIGITATIGVRSYIESVERGKATAAATLVNMIGNANRMYADNNKGQFVGGCFSYSPCNSVVADCQHAADPLDACTLVWCKYLADQDWQTKSYYLNSCNPAGGSVEPVCDTIPGLVSVAFRQGGSGAYASWGYGLDQYGVMHTFGGAPVQQP